jgi:hypothetical protein
MRQRNKQQLKYGLMDLKKTQTKGVVACGDHYTSTD